MMHHDLYRDLVYFEKFIYDQQKRIGRFKELADSSVDDAKIEASKIIVNRYKDLISAMFSHNADLNDIKKAVEEYANYLSITGFSSFSQYVDFLSLLIIVGIHEEVYIPVPQQYDDDISRILNNYISGKNEPLNGVLLFPDYYGIFRDYCSGEVVLNELLDYVENKWYGSSEELYWFNSHLKSTDTYAGYWCYIASAVLKIKDQLSIVPDDAKYIIKTS